MAMEGMDISVMTGVHGKLVSLQGQLESVMSGLGSEVSTAAGAWKGPDSTQFENDWNSDYRPALSRLGTELQQYAQKVQQHIQRQQQTSATF